MDINNYHFVYISLWYWQFGMLVLLCPVLMLVRKHRRNLVYWVREVLLYSGIFFSNSWCRGIISLCCVAVAACPEVIVATRFATHNNDNIINVTNMSDPANIPWARGERRICNCDIYEGEPHEVSRTVWFRHRNRQRQINQRGSQEVQP